MPAPLKHLTPSTTDPTLNRESVPPPVLPKLFSAPSLVCLIVGVIFLFISLQQLGVYLFAPIVLDKVLGNELSSAQWLSLGSENGTVTSYAMLFTLVLIILAIFGLLKGRIHWVKFATTELKTKVNNRLAILPARQSHNYHNSYSVADYLALKPFSVRIGVILIGLWLLYWCISEALTYWLGSNPTEFVDVLYDSAQPKWLLILVIVIAAPFYEELMFRGVLWSGLREQISGQGGVWLASIVTSVLFALIHLQYAAYEMSIIFCLAMLMSYARYKSGSLWLPLLIHIINNGVAMGQYLLIK